MSIIIELAKETDIDELAKLYDDLNDHLAKGINYPGWRKGIYPIRESALHGLTNNNLYVARINEKIVGSIILSHEAEKAYHKAKWAFDSDYSDVFVVHTFAIHPDFLKCGIGKTLLDFASELAVKSNIKAIRLDVTEKNIPAIKLYEKCGFKYIDTVDLGLGEYGLPWFKLYEKLI